MLLRLLKSNLAITATIPIKDILRLSYSQEQVRTSLTLMFLNIMAAGSNCSPFLSRRRHKCFNKNSQSIYSSKWLFLINLTALMESYLDLAHKMRKNRSVFSNKSVKMKNWEKLEMDLRVQIIRKSEFLWSPNYASIISKHFYIKEHQKEVIENFRVFNYFKITDLL